MRKIKNCLSALAVALCGGSVFAEDAQNVFNFETVNTQMTGLKTSLEAWGQSFLPILIGIVAVFIGYWLLKFAIRLVKGMASASK